MADRKTGKQSYFIYNGFNIFITKYSLKVDRKLADITDNGDYDVATDLMYPTQLPVNAVAEISAEGRFRQSVTPIAIMAPLYSGATAIPATLGLDAGSLSGHGLFDISNFNLDVPVDDTVTFSCSLKSNGKFTPNS
jgi:hypothetical protein